MTKAATKTSIIAALVLLVPAAQAQDYSGHTAVLGMSETITDPLSGEEGRITIFRQDLGNGQLNHDFVYGDPRRALFNGGNAGVNYAVKADFPSADVNLLNQAGWMHDSVAIWDSQRCSNLSITENPTTPGLPGVVDLFFQTGIIFGIWEADITQVGFLGSPFFAAGSSTLGVTYTLFWVDGAGNLTDIDNNGKFDVAFREIYYNDNYEWADNGLEGPQPAGPRIFDFPTVAIHEVGHGVSAGHFGTIGIQNGLLVAHPRSIMNAIYGGTLRHLAGRDRGANCSNWAQWPNR